MSDPLDVAREKVPDEISMVKIIESRYSEINQLVNEIRAKAPKLISQKLPLHMRRRAASHNVNRLPSRARKLLRRKLAGKELTSESKEKKRKHCKKYQNKRKMAINQASRSAKPDRCLLHLWFVKRFKMVHLHGLATPNINTTKNRRKLHRMSKNGCIHFYLPYIQCIQVRYKVQDSWLLVDRLTSVVHYDSNEDILCPDQPPDRWMLTISDQQGDIIGPGHFILIPKMNLLLVLTHVAIFHKVIDLFENIFAQTDISIEDASRGYQLFKFFGPESLRLMKNTLGKAIGSHIPDTFQRSSFIFSEIKFSYQGEPTLVDVDRMEIVPEAEVEKIVIMSDTIGETHSTDIIVPYQQAKPFWYRLVRNRSHLVGGLHDYKVIASDLHRLFYPDFGFPDSPLSEEKDRKQWSDLLEHLTGERNYYVLRDHNIIQRLRDRCMSAEELSQLLHTNEKLKRAFLIVELICLNRGIPGKEDFVSLPTKDDLNSFITKSRVDLRLDESGYGPKESKKAKLIKSFKDSSRKVIGFVEFGHFSLEMGVGKAFAAISLLEVVPLLSFERHGDLIALTRSQKSQYFRCVKVIIDNFMAI